MASKFSHAATGALGGVELDVRLRGVGIAQHADALAVDDLVGLLQVAEGQRETPASPLASAGTSSIRTTG
jgi:hypothetical protein